MSWWGRRILMGVLCAFASLPSLGAAQAAPTFSIIDPDLVVAAIPGRTTLIVKGEGFDAADANKPLENPKDLRTPEPPSVEVKFEVRELDRSNSARRWVLTASVEGDLLPANVAQKRYLSFAFNGAEYTLAYTLTNKSAASFAWTVKGPPGEINLDQGRGVDIGIAVQDVAATKVRLMQTALIEQTTKAPVAGTWALCRSQKGPCDTSIDLDPHSSNRLWLRPTDNADIVGKYTGTVTIGASEKPDGQTFNLTIYGTTLAHQVAGALVIALGVVLAWVSTIWFQNRIERARLLLPATLLRARVSALQQRLSAAPAQLDADLTHTRQKLARVLTALSERELDAQSVLPAKWIPIPRMSSSAEAYQNQLSQLTRTTIMLETLIENGFKNVWSIPNATDPHKLPAIRKAIRKLDDLAMSDPIPDTNVLIDRIHAILTELHGDITGAEAVPEGFAPQLPAYEQLSVEIRNFSAMTWLVFAILATALGTYILVILNLGFGVATDYFVCLFWGFGLPVGGQQLAQSTVGSVATVLGIPVPKSGSTRESTP